MELDIKVMWCKGLTAFNFFQKLTVYAAVFITTKHDSLKLTQDHKQEQKTPVDDDGGGNPEWNHAMKFDLRPLRSISPGLENLSLLFELRNQGQLFGYKTIGEVRVPLTELIHSVGGEVVRYVKYEVRSPDGKHNGILDFSYKLTGNINDAVSPNNSIHHMTGFHQHHHLDGNVVPVTDPDTHVIGYHHHQHTQLDGNVAQCTDSGTAVMGYHHHSQSDGNTTNSDTHVMGYHYHQSQSDGNTTQITDQDTRITGYYYLHHHHHSQLEESEKIQYPKIDLEGILAPPLVYPSLVVPAFYPPPPQLWGPPVELSHYPPPHPSAYPPTPLPPQHQQANGDPYWGYSRPPDYHQW